jgi:hypothetical protein
MTPVGWCIFRVIPAWVEANLESLQKPVFPFASRHALQYRLLRISQGVFVFHDCLFLQRPYRPRCSKRRQRGG